MRENDGALADTVVWVLDEQATRKTVLNETREDEALTRDSHLAVAALGALRKPNDVVTARALVDRTPGISVNRRTRIWDQERAPTAADLKRSREAPGQRTCLSTANVSEQIPVPSNDATGIWWGAKSNLELFVNKVGTFGVASASYSWSRVASALGALRNILARDTAHTWHMLVADDCHLEAGGSGDGAAMIVFPILGTVCGVPLSWGFSYCIEATRCTSQHRTDWFIRWAREISTADFFHLTNVEGLGRIMYVVVALKYEWLSLGPLRRLGLSDCSAVRLVHHETRFQAAWTWMPYGVISCQDLVFCALAKWQARRPQRPAICHESS